MKNLIFIIALSLATSGCFPAAVAYTGYRISQAQEESSKTMARSTETIAYSNYKTRMEAINFQREKSGMKPQPVLSLEEWKATLR